jgi:uncharacterized protein (DUF1800 family)
MSRTLSSPIHHIFLTSRWQNSGVEPTARDIAHLHRRFGFGISAADLDRLTPGGYEAAVEALFTAPASDAADSVPVPSFTAHPLSDRATASLDARRALTQQVHADAAALAGWWLDRLVSTTWPLREKVTLLWHGHFATSIAKVRFAALMHGQNELLRRQGLASFPDLVGAMLQDPAMLVWLDGEANRAGAPNENLGRELMELFTLGHGNYDETDVKEAARSLTGWAVNRTTGAATFVPRRHDTGTKTVLGQTGTWATPDIARIVTSQPVGQRFVVAKLWSLLATPVDPSASVVDTLLPAYGAGDVEALLRAIALHPDFRSAASRTGLVKQPIEWVVGSLRALGVAPGAFATAGKTPTTGSAVLTGVFARLGQVPFAPPSVGGWPQNGGWLSTATAATRLEFAARLVALADLSAVTAAPAATRPDVVARILSVEWGPSTRSSLSSVAGDPVGLTALGLVAPEHVLA